MFAIRSAMETLRLGGHALAPLPCGALFWPARRLLIVADLHLEKGSALARQGWLVPPYDSRDTLARLERAIATTGATAVLALGDSFHDAAGPCRLPDAERHRLAALIARVDWTWIVGNHDGHAPGTLGGRVVREWEVEGLRFRHEAGGAGPEVSGHFHPKVRLPGVRGPARRCFALAGERLVLPAYGSYAGGLDIASPELAEALGEPPVALLPSARGIVRIVPERCAA